MSTLCHLGSLAHIAHGLFVWAGHYLTFGPTRSTIIDTTTSRRSVKLTRVIELKVILGIFALRARTVQGRSLIVSLGLGDNVKSSLARYVSMRLEERTSTP